MPEVLSPINLLPKKPPGKLPLERKLIHYFGGLGRVIIIGTEIILLASLALRFKLDKDLDTLAQSLEEKQALIRASLTLEKDVRLIQEKISTLNLLLEDEPTFSPFLSEFAGMLPSRVTLTGFNLAQKEFNLSAKASSGLDFAHLISNLLSSEKFLEIVLTKARFDAQEQVYKFSLEAVFKS